MRYLHCFKQHSSKLEHKHYSFNRTFHLTQYIKLTLTVELISVIVAIWFAIALPQYRNTAARLTLQLIKMTFPLICTNRTHSNIRLHMNSKLYTLNWLKNFQTSLWQYEIIFSLNLAASIYLLNLTRRF